MPHTSSDLPRRVRHKASTSGLVLRSTSSHFSSQSSEHRDSELELLLNLAVLRARIAELHSEPQRALDAIATEALAITRAKGAAVALPEGTAVTCRATVGTLVPPLGTEVDLENGLTGACLRTGEVVFCHDSQIDSRVERADQSIRSILIAPVKRDGVAIGVLAVVSGLVRAFGEADEIALRALATLVAGLDFAHRTEKAPIGNPPKANSQNQDEPLPVAAKPASDQRWPITATQISRALRCVRKDTALQVLLRAKAHLRIESLYDGVERADAIDVLEKLAFERAGSMGVTFSTGNDGS